MRKTIHSTAIISDKAIIGDDVEIGPFCVIGEDVILSNGVKLKAHVCIDGNTSIGENTSIYPFATIGYQPQDLKYNNEKSSLIIGKNNVIREYCTIHPGTYGGGMKTIIGNNCLFMIGTHIAHDCIVGNNVIMANNTTLGGHVLVGDYAIFGGLSAVHQFVRIGAHSMIGGGGIIVEDLIPYGIAIGERSTLRGINIVGMKRRNFTRDEINAAQNVFEEIFGKKNHENKNKNIDIDNDQFITKVKKIQTKYTPLNIKSAKDMIDFLLIDSKRSICMPEWLKNKNKD